MRRILLLLAACLFGVATGVCAQGYTTPPILNPSNAALSTPLIVPYSAGLVTIGGFQQVVPVGTVTVADNQYACGAPQFAACNLIYWSGSSPVVLQSTTNPALAFATGNTVVDYVTTFGGQVTSVVAGSLTLEGTPGTQVPFSTGVSLLPICNPVVTFRCQPRNQTLSGY